MPTKMAFDEPIYLTDAELFRDLTPAEVDALSERMPAKEVVAGTVFYSPEQPTEVLHFLKKGRVHLFYLSAEGKAFTTAILEAGTFFGEMAILGQSLYGKYAEAVTPCTLCVIDREQVKNLLLGDLRISNRLVEMLGKRLAETERRLADLALKRLPARTAALLLHLADRKNAEKPCETGLPVEVAYTHEELAQMVGTQRETINRVLNEFQSEGLIKLHRGRIVLLRIDDLKYLTLDSRKI